jgi:cell wall-associated NlpC family hydrolase
MSNRSVAARATILVGGFLSLALSAPAPAGAAGVYLVEPGDTLSAISRLFEVGVDQIIEANHLASAAISPGDRLRIPDPAPNAVTAAETSQHREVAADRVLQAVCHEEKVYHSVVRGDTLFSIAGRYGTDVDRLVQLNGLRKKDRLAIGQRILVRKSGPRSHTVARGETLSRIARLYRIDVDEISRLNRLEQHTIVPGQHLLIEPCDPIAVAGSAPPPLGGRDSSGLAGALGTAGAGSAAGIAKRVTAVARTMLNVPYRFGGSTLRGIDCSAYVQRVFGLLDVRIPRTAREQYSVGAPVDRDELQVGDLVFFRTYASYASHVGIYLGDDRFIHASSMVRRVAIDSIALPYYRKRFIGARRLVVDAAPAVASTP